jgi:hypothetical protein
MEDFRWTPLANGEEAVWGDEANGCKSLIRIKPLARFFH